MLKEVGNDDCDCDDEDDDDDEGSWTTGVMLDG